MHLLDGTISPHISVPAWAGAAPLWYLAFKKGFGGDALERVPVAGSLTAFAFVIQTIMIPVPGGTSAHLSGSTLLAILFNPLLAFSCESLVLLIQALILGMGGLTVLPLNAILLGFVGPAAGWVIHRSLRRLHEPASLFAAGWAGSVTSAACLGLVLGIQHAVSPSHFPIPAAVAVPAVLLPHLLVAGPLEGLYTVSAHALLRRVLKHAAG